MNHQIQKTFSSGHNLKVLALRHSVLYDEDCEILARVAANLTALDLCGNRWVTGIGFSHIAKESANLKAFGIRDTAITAKDVQSVLNSETKPLKQLKVLIVSIEEVKNFVEIMTEAKRSCTISCVFAWTACKELE